MTLPAGHPRNAKFAPPARPFGPAYGWAPLVLIWLALLCALPATAEIRLPPLKQDLDLSTVNRLYKSAAYRVDIKPAGTSDDHFQQAFVFETRNDWVVRDYFNSNPARHQDIKRASDQVGRGKSDLRTASFSNMSFDEPVDVRVTLLTPGQQVDQVQIRPLRFAIPPHAAPDRRSVTFTLDRPRKVSIEINGRLDPLFIFADTPDAPDLNATYYYGPGLHRIPGDGTLVLKSNERVYIAAGAIVEGRFLLETGSSHITIHGRGILSGGAWPDLQVNDAWQVKHSAIYTTGSDHFLLDGITFAQSTTWQVAMEDFSPHGNATHDNVYRDLNTVSWNGCTDGIWITGNDNRVENAFIFNNDDAFVTKGGRNTKVSDAVFWGGTWGRFFLFFNIQGNTPPVENLTVENIDIIGKEAAPALILFQNWAPADKRPVKTTRNVTFRNITFEERRRPGNSNNFAANPAHLIELDTNAVPGAVSGLVFENLSLDQIMPNEGELLGTPASPITDVKFIDVRAGDKRLQGASALPLTVNAQAQYSVEAHP